MDLSLLFRVLDLVAVGCQVAANLVSIIKLPPTITHFVGLMITVVIGLAIIFADFNICAGYVRYFGFVVPILGRGLALVVLAVLLWVSPSANVISFVLNLIIVVVGLVYVIFGTAAIFRGDSKQPQQNAAQVP